ncbi:E4 SUMO-protein ligase PIAL1 isoform X1 [Brassica rapa]|uniref:E4 SUMO-protein ligase PIAL1 n=1 Tax=Brassica napus TaxID=3708 RepID=UPI0004F1A730|nr:E4 SUMO-protein ligase PIAL1 isoform X1 [Brassica rapa]XP_013641039.2 E4 SUMO-protein ligase PIAL1 [Brassica napus]
MNPQSSRLSDHTDVNSNEFHAYLLSLATRIDAAIWNNEVPGNTQELASTLNQVGQCKCSDQTKAVIMTLLMSVKSACELGWFPQRESQQLLVLVYSMLTTFTDSENVPSSPTPNGSFSLIPQVMERFYPFLKLGHILVSSEADAESFALVKPFHISKNIVEHSPRPRPGLFVFRTDDISNSSCIIHPQEVSFSLNGRGVDKRHISSMDSRPQRPTNLYNMLVDGANLLQTLGSFGGSYFIVIALLHDIPPPVYPSLKDYVNESDSACDIPKEGPSRISLSCPISRKRIKLPVKGHACKHLQCFDYWNYIKINTRVPFWCCPHCYQFVCYTDIRLDQTMIKILEEVGSNVTDVVISPDGSWKVVTENDENVEATNHHGDTSSSQNLSPTVLDLTRDDNEMETSGNSLIPMVNQSSDSVEALPQTLNVNNDGQQQFPVSSAREVIHMPFLPTSLPQDRVAANTGGPHIPMPGAHSSQYQGLHVSSLGLSLGRDSDLMERWNHHNYGNCIPQTQFHLPTRSLSPVQERPIPSSFTSPQTLAFNYGGTSDQRHMQRHNPGGAGEQLSSREFMNMTPDNSANRPQQIRMMRGSITPGSTRYDHLIIRPTQRPVQSQSQAQTLPPPQPTAYSHVPVQSQAQTFLANPSYPVGTNETQAGSSLLPLEEDVAPLGSFWSVPRET